MKEGQFTWLMITLIICATIAFKIEMDHFFPIQDTNMLAQMQCIKNNGVPVNGENGTIVYCQLYGKITGTPVMVPLPELTPTPTAGGSAKPIISSREGELK